MAASQCRREWRSGRRQIVAPAGVAGADDDRLAHFANRHVDVDANFLIDTEAIPVTDSDLNPLPPLGQCSRRLPEGARCTHRLGPWRRYEEASRRFGERRRSFRRSPRPSRHGPFRRWCLLTDCAAAAVGNSRPTRSRADVSRLGTASRQQRACIPMSPDRRTRSISERWTALPCARGRQRTTNPSLASITWVTSADSATPASGMNCLPMSPEWTQSNFGAPGGIRTPDLRLRRPALYPTELRARMRSGRWDPDHTGPCTNRAQAGAIDGESAAGSSRSTSPRRCARRSDAPG